ncbi:MAG: alpha/beta hydrolase [Verrucomicrobiae bacterium]|nr:alpha/beta hydrolase [Verrucomicrobiae bacterium]
MANAAQLPPPPVPPALDWTTDGVSAADSAPWPANAVPQLLGAWSFDQATNLSGYRGDPPIIGTNLFLVSSPWGRAIRLSPDQPASLRFKVRQANNNGDFSVRNGTVSLWIRPDWNPGGSSAPTVATPLVEVGTESTARTGWWAWLVNPGGNQVRFLGQARGQEVTWLQAPVAFKSGQWTHLALTWSPSNSVLYVNGARVVTGSGVTHWPALAERSSAGWGLGSDATGVRRLRADFDLLVTANYPLSAAGVAGQFAAAVAAQGRGATSASTLASLAGGAEFGTPILPANFRSGLWIEGALGALSGVPGGWLRGTAAGVRYEIFTAKSPSGPWALDQSLAGASGQTWTAFSLATSKVPTGFVLAAPFSDADADGLSDEFERRVSRTSIANADSDGDGMPDGWEVQYGLNPNVADGHKDNDGDGIVNTLEYLHGRNPIRADAIPLISVSTSVATVQEGRSTGKFILRRTAPLTDALQVSVEWTGSSVNGSDYTSLPSEITFPAGASEVSFTVNPLVDGLDEKDESVILTVGRGLIYGRNTTYSARMTIQDADLPSVALDAPDPDASEPELGRSNPGKIEIRRAGLTDQALVVPIRRGASSTAVSGTDYVALPASMTIPAGETRASLSIVPVNNRQATGDRLLAVEIAPPTSASPYTITTGKGAASVLIRDIEPPTVTVQAEVAMAEEKGLRPGRFRFTRTGGTSVPLTVFYAVGGTANPGTAGYRTYPADYQTLPGCVVIPAGSASALVDVVPIADAELEPLETVQITLTGSLDYTIGTANTALVTIDDSNAATWTSRLVQPTSVAGTDGPTGLIQVTRLGTVSSDMTLRYQVLGQRTLLPSGRVFSFSESLPAGSPASYAMTVSGGRLGSGAGTLLMPRGVVSMDVGIKATLPTAEVAGATLRLESGSTAEINHPVVFLDRWHLVTVERVDHRVTEGAQVIVRLTAAAKNPTGTLPTIVRLLLGGTATVGADFTVAGGIQGSNADGARFVDVPIPAAPPSGSVRSATVTIATTADGRAEAGAETLVIRHDPAQLSSAHSALPAARPYASVQIRDNASIAFPALDSDQDGLPDAYEVEHGMDPLTPTKTLADTDRDGILDLAELIRGTRYDNSDSDNDGVNDFLESLLGTNPLVADAGLAVATRDYVPVRLVTAAALRSTEGTCFKCHAPGMTLGGVEQLAHLENPDSPSLMFSRNLLLTPGSTLPVTLTPPPNYVANASTLRTYTAQIESVDPTRPPGFLVLEGDSAKPLLGVNRPIDSATFTTRRATLCVLRRPKLAVDTDRDGTIRFDASDATTFKRPYRFWVNNDNDTMLSAEEPERINSTVQDHQNGTIDNIRDLEDFSRIWIDLAGLQKGLAAGNVKFVFEWRNVTSGHPAIQLYRASDPAGGLGYLLNRADAVKQALPNAVQTGFSHAMTSEDGTTRKVSPDKRFVIPYVYWNGSQDLSCFLFEAASPGTGQLVFQLIQGEKVLVESEPLYLELLDVKQMYRRIRATPADGFTQPYVYNLVQPPRVVPNIESWDLGLPPVPSADGNERRAVFVHGWNMRPEESLNFSETMFKRLWHSGFKGEFVAFRWPTHRLNSVEWTDPDLFDSFNFSEHRAWIYGESLKRLLGQQSGFKQAVICHSMGATVLTSALRLDAEPDSAIFMQAAIPASVYDTRDLLFESTLIQRENEGYYFSRTPNLFSNEGGYGGMIQRNVNNAMNFYNAADYALQTGKAAIGLVDVHWVENQRRRPSLPFGYSYHGYVWDPKVAKPFFAIRRVTEFTPRRPVLDPAEVLAFVSRSRTRGLGAEGRVRGFLNPAATVNLDTWKFGALRSDHSGQFNRSIQEVVGIYDQVEGGISQ